METILIAIFVLGYAAITMEHTLKLDKLVPALLMMTMVWTVIVTGIDDMKMWNDPANGLVEGFSSFDHAERMHLFEHTLLHHFGKVAEIMIFLMGAMAIVEMIDHFGGFESIRRMIRVKSKRALLWIVALTAFGLSAVIDNLTATIVLITILRKLIPDVESRMWYSGIVIIAANAGGAWTPIGDVTTTMLWMDGKVTGGKLLMHVLLPSILNVLAPLLIASFFPAFNGHVVFEDKETRAKPYSGLMLSLGLALIVFVPVFKVLTHLPPYVGMMLSLSVFAVVAEILSSGKMILTYGNEESNTPHHGPTLKALSKIEIPSLLFFLGILMTVAGLESVGMIHVFGETISAHLSQSAFVGLLGLSSAVIDNVPLVAAGLGMFQDGVDAPVWHEMAYAAGTGGSILIIGSAAGVVAMGMEKISFFWYLKRISWIALAGYAAGFLIYLI